MKNYGSVFVVLLLIFAVFHGCKKDDSEEDKVLFGEVSTANREYRNGAVLSPKGNSPHGNFKLKFNLVAWNALDSTGELPSGSQFPEGSILVKEVVSSGNTTLYAIMKKQPSSVYNGNGWLWAEYHPDGSTAISVTKKGNEGGCVSCHSNNVNRDMTNTFDLH